MSTLAGCTIEGSNGSMTIRPLSINPRIVASDRTDEGCRSAVTAVLALYDECMPNIGPLELVIVLVIVLVIFGPKRLPGLGRSLGSGMREFKDSVTGKTKDDEREQLEADARAHAETEARHP
jgi:sec-independent protein translocase protein TatA